MIRTFMMLAAMALALAAAGEAAAVSPVLAQTPEQFLRAIYNAYAGDPAKAPGISIENEASVRKYFAPDLAAMIIADTEKARAEEGVPELDFDPFVNSQSFQLAGPVAITVTNQTADRAVAVVTFTNSSTKERLTYTLVKSAGGWRISDITWQLHAPDTGEQTLRSLFRQ